MLLLNNMNYPLNAYGSYFPSMGLGGDFNSLNNSSLLGSPSLQSGFYSNPSMMGTDFFSGRQVATTDSVTAKTETLKTELANLTVLKIGDTEHLNQLFFGTDDPDDEQVSELSEAEQASYASIKSILEEGTEISSLSTADRNIALGKISQAMKSEDSDLAANFKDRYGDLITAKSDGSPQLRLHDFNLVRTGSETAAYEKQAGIVASALVAQNREKANLASLSNNFNSPVSSLGYNNSSLYSSSLDIWQQQDALANQLASTNPSSLESSSDDMWRGL